MKSQSPDHKGLKQTFITSGETAKILGLSTVTVQKLADQKQLIGWRTEGGHRRLHRQSVIDYLQKQPSHITLNEHESNFTVLLITDDPKKLKAQDEGWLHIGAKEKIQITGSIMEAMLLLNRRTIGMLIIELHRSPSDLELLLQELVKSCTKQKLRLMIALFTPDKRVHLPNSSDHIRVHHIAEKLKSSHIQSLWLGSQINRHS